MDTIKKLILSVFLILPFLVYAGEAININTADKETLMAIKGVGEKRAEAIIMYREKNGPFTSLDQLTNIKGVGNSFLEKNRDNLIVSNPE